MSEKSGENVVNLSSERARRVHDLHEKRLQGVRAAFVKALPITATPARKKKNPKKKR